MHYDVSLPASTATTILFALLLVYFTVPWKGAMGPVHRERGTMLACRPFNKPDCMTC